MSFLLKLMFSSGWMFCLFVCAQSGTCWFVARYIGELEQVGVVGLTSVRLGWWFCQSDVCLFVFFFNGCRNLRHIWKGFLWDSLGTVGWSTTTAISHHLPIPGAILKSPKTCSMSIHVRCVSTWRWWSWIFVGPFGGARWSRWLLHPFQKQGAWVHRDAASGEGCESPSRTWKEVCVWNNPNDTAVDGSEIRRSPVTYGEYPGIS